jgi:hypothetical protein
MPEPAAEQARKLCFVIAPIGDSGSETRKRSDQVFKYIIEPCAKECGYAAVRADQISEPGIITNQVIQHLIDDALVVADLSERNPNVFYELAIRHVLRKPLVQIIRRGESIPFDVAAMRMIQVDHQDLDSVAEAKAEIIKQIRAIEADPSKVSSPVSAAVNLESLRRSEKPQDQFLADIASSLAELRTAVARIERSEQFTTPFLSPTHLKFYGGAEPEVLWIDPTTLKPSALQEASPQKVATRKRIVEKGKPTDPCPCGSGKEYQKCHGAAPA